MEQAVRAPSMAALIGEAYPALAPIHNWTVDPATRAHIDWTRGTLLLVADDFMELSPFEMRRIMAGALHYLDMILPRVTGAADRRQLMMARMLVAATHDNYSALTLDTIAAEAMEAVRLLVTGTDYHDMDEPEELTHGRA